MQLNNIEIRELRSLKLKLKSVKLKSLFESTTNLAFFMMTDNIQPDDRIALRKKFAEYDLELTFLSKKLLKLWMKNPEWLILKNLLSGNVVRITRKTNPCDATPFSTEILNFIQQQKQFDLRCVVWNQQIYRKEKWLEYLNKAQIDFKKVFIEETLKLPLKKSPLYEGLFFTQTHYI